MSWVATNSVKVPTNDKPSTLHTKDKILSKVTIGMGKQPQFYPGDKALRVYECDIDDMSLVATNSTKMPMNDIPSTSQEKDKVLSKAIVGMGSPQFHQGNIASRVFQ